MALGDAFAEIGDQGGGGAPASIDALEAEITTLAAHIGAATYRLLVLIEEFDLLLPDLTSSAALSSSKGSHHSFVARLASNATSNETTDQNFRVKGSAGLRPSPTRHVRSQRPRPAPLHCCTRAGHATRPRWARVAVRILEMDGSATAALDPLSMLLVVTDGNPNGVTEVWSVPRSVERILLMRPSRCGVDLFVEIDREGEDSRPLRRQRETLRLCFLSEDGKVESVLRVSEIPVKGKGHR